jgi:hypothetical protein
MIRTIVKRFILRLYEWRIINIGQARRVINRMGVNDA